MVVTPGWEGEGSRGGSGCDAVWDYGMPLKRQGNRTTSVHLSVVIRPGKDTITQEHNRHGIIPLPENGVQANGARRGGARVKECAQTKGQDPGHFLRFVHRTELRVHDESSKRHDRRVKVGR